MIINTLRVMSFTPLVTDKLIIITSCVNIDQLSLIRAIINARIL